MWDCPQCLKAHPKVIITVMLKAFPGMTVGHNCSFANGRFIEARFTETVSRPRQPWPGGIGAP